MADNSLVYSNARVKTLENGLLTVEKFNRMVFSDNLDEGVKVLFENNYGGGIIVENNDFDKLLSEEDRLLSVFVKECMPKNSGMESFLITNDYHNAKACCKAKYSGIEVESMLAPDGQIDAQMLKQAIFSDKYDALDKTMSDALLSIDIAFANGNRSPRLIDATLDKAMFKKVNEIAKKTKNKSIIDYWKSSADFANISSFKRCRKVNESLEFYKEGFVDGGELPISFFESIFESDNDAISEKFKYTTYKNVVGNLFDNGDFIEFERHRDNFLLNIFKEKKNDIFTISPIAGYYVAKKTEIKVARMILICLKNNVEKGEIKKRLRDYYA